jgi:hypothetical protein
VGGQFGPIPVCFWGGFDRLNLKVNPANSVETVFDLFAFPFKLGFVSDGLILASTANPEQFAFGFDPVGRGVENLHAIGIGIVFMVPIDLRLDCLSRKGEGNLYDPTIISGDAESQIGDAFNN